MFAKMNTKDSTAMRCDASIFGAVLTTLRTRCVLQFEARKRYNIKPH
jgi:hypothetical protein